MVQFGYFRKAKNKDFKFQTTKHTASDTAEASVENINEKIPFS